MASDDKPTSIWKKEISFRRKADDETQDHSSGESIWKKEISLRKKANDSDVIEPPVPTAPEVDVDAAIAALAQAEPAAVASVSEPPAPVPAVEHDWLTRPLEQVSEPPSEPVVVAVPTPAPVPARTPELDLPTAVLPVPPADPGPTATADSAVEKVPFYKRDLSFKRAPKAPKEKRDEPRKVPFYKRDLSFKRAPKEWDPAEATTVVQPKPKTPRPARASFSPPTFSRKGSSKQIVGLKVGGSQIAAARVHNGDTLELVQAARFPLDHGIVVNGELRDPEALAVALKEFFAKNKLPKRGVRLGIANNRIGVRTFEVVGIDDPKQLANAIRFRAQEVLPIPLEEAVLDYQVLGDGVTEEGQPLRRVLLVVAYRELVDRYVYACRKAGLQIVGIDLEAFALLRTVAAPQDQVGGHERGALVAVSVGHDRSTFAVSDGRVCEFTRVLEWGGWALNVAIARALDLSPSEVEPLKRALSFFGDDAPEGFNAEQFATAREAARRQLQTFARELVSSLQFYQNQPGSLGIGEIALTGGTAHLPGLGEELERLIGVPVRVVNPLHRLKVSKKARDHEQVGSLAVAIGLGIDD